MTCGSVTLVFETTQLYCSGFCALMLPVWCLLWFTQNGGLQLRHLAFSKDRRKLLVTSRRIRSVKGLWRAAMSSTVSTSATTGHKSIALHWMDRVDRGSLMSSPRLTLLEQSHTGLDAAQRAAVQKYIVADQCLSIVYTSSEGRLESLDVVVPSKTDFDALLTSVDELMYLARKELNRYTSRMQCLHYHWMCLGKDWESPLSLPEVMTLSDAMQTPTAKKPMLSNLFKEKCAEAKEERLSMNTIAQLLQIVQDSPMPVSPRASFRDPLHQLWVELVETDPVPIVGYDTDDEDDATVEVGILGGQSHSISAVALLSFIRSKQKNYTATLEQVTEFVRQLNEQSSGEKTTSTATDDDARKDRLTKARFVSWLTSDVNDIVHPDAARLGADDMTLPLSYYWISTSHDTYLGNVPVNLGGKSVNNGGAAAAVELDASLYSAALLRGVRCIELDVWDDSTSKEPVVGLRPNSKSIPLRQVLKSIRYFLNQHPYCFPIVLKLENRCSTTYQSKMANMFYEYFGAANLIVKPPEDQKLSSHFPLPSPESARGMIIIMGKRPKKVRVGCSFLNDDLDNDAWQILDATTAGRLATYADEDDDITYVQGWVVGFDDQGPIRSKANDASQRSPADLLTIARADADRAMAEKEASVLQKNEMWQKVDYQEQLTAKLTQEAGMWPEEVKRRAAKAATRAINVSETVAEEKNSKDEGLEIHEILSNVVEGNQDSYAEAVQEAAEAEQLVALRLADRRAAELALERAESDLLMSQQLERTAIENAKKAAAEARTHQEHADVANERVEQVHALFRNSKEYASSAGTVVQTAVTEAKISEKRAVDAEVRAERARAAADKDRLRAEDETKAEEALEQEVSELHMACQEATETSQEARVRLDKANAMYERVNEQIKLIEKSSQYRKELNSSNGEVSNVRHGGSFLAKHEAKLEECATCRELIKEASEERSAAETRLIMLKTKFEERARAWRAQANLAAQLRRTADRSTHVADELAEHAEEEREAAQLRQAARDKALETVENRGSLRESVEAQLAEAQRAATEAAERALQSRVRAQKLEKEIEKIADHSSFIQNVEKRKLDVEQVRQAFDLANAEKVMKDRVLEEEKRRLETNSYVFQSATRDAANDADRSKVIQVLQQEAIASYNTAILLRKEAESASTKADVASSVADAKKKASDHAQEYKEQKDMMVEMPALLAKLTLVHSGRYLDWQRSIESPQCTAHSFAQNLLFDMLDADPDLGHACFHAYTRDHLCRVFSPWSTVSSKLTLNCDPVYAWSLGCQLVAMNYQFADERLLTADGRFRRNGSSGYVLKPLQLTDRASKPEPFQTWSFSIISAHNLPKVGRKTINPRVKICLHSGDASEPKQFKTKAAGPNGLNPVWGGKSDEFTFTVTDPSVAMVSLSVWDTQEQSESFVGGASLPVSCLREGHRSVALFSMQHSRPGLLRYSTLIVKATRR
jgi:Phosphatidylinositol-specific phospholipase C, X domain/Phosphatidylinositol-specific phospholipase C, Y domain/C2 domain